MGIEDRLSELSDGWKRRRAEYAEIKKRICEEEKKTMERAIEQQLEQTVKVRGNLKSTDEEVYRALQDICRLADIEGA